MSANSKTKVCSDCKKKYHATLEYFYKNNQTNDRLCHQCKKCHTIYHKKWREANKEKNKNIKDNPNETKKCSRCKKILPKTREYFNMNRSHSDGFYHYCKFCRSEKYKKTSRNLHLKKKFGINEEEYFKLLNKQNNVCAICGRMEMSRRSKKRMLSIDHNHKTKKIRGILCQTCNTIIGMGYDNTFILVRAIKYLRGDLYLK